MAERDAVGRGLARRVRRTTSLAHVACLLVSLPLTRFVGAVCSLAVGLVLGHGFATRDLLHDVDELATSLVFACLFVLVAVLVRSRWRRRRRPVPES
ncbi:hypothetical protein AB0D38_14445 [Streptomyces sp. NPDC048279]|uniref:hypothetical protein n=1 Tax=Streptomyces sp. NPDC048279 TaxID=3154714 RepID=UPI003432E8C6